MARLRWARIGAILGILATSGGQASTLLATPLVQTDAQFRVTVPNGVFEFRSVQVSKCGKAVCVKGEISNLTTADWGGLQFRLQLKDKAGVPILLGSDGYGVFGLNLDSWALPKGVRSKFSDQIKIDIKSDVGSFEIIGWHSGAFTPHYVFSLLKPSSNPTLNWSDDLIQVRFEIRDQNQISFSLKNLTDGAIRIDWDQASFVDPKGEAHRVRHKGVRFSEAEKSQPPTTVPPRASFTDLIVRGDTPRLVVDQWFTPILFPDGPYALELKGKTFSVFMVLQINGASKDYNFVFRIDDVS